MATSLRAERAASPPATGNGAARPLRRRRTLPGGRAVVGGFLVALAAVGIFAGYTNATADDREPFLVARRDLPLGHRITRADLGTLPMDLPGLLRARSYRDATQLLGSVVIGPVAKGELIQSSDVLSGEDGSGLGRHISFPIESARAVDGSLRRGEFVDLLATYGTGADGYTVVVVRGARLADRHESEGTLADSGDEVITLALGSDRDAVAVAHAVNAGVVTLVRTGAPPQDGTAAGDSRTTDDTSATTAPAPPPTYATPEPTAPLPG
ncbi:MAG: SAF domain-containing protein [Acidimicrobiales bacterium]